MQSEAGKSLGHAIDKSVGTAYGKKLVWDMRKAASFRGLHTATS
jgi:hypothetical protein